MNFLSVVCMWLLCSLSVFCTQDSTVNGTTSTPVTESGPPPKEWRETTNCSTFIFPTTTNRVYIITDFNEQFNVLMLRKADPESVEYRIQIEHRENNTISLQIFKEDEQKVNISLVVPNDTNAKMLSISWHFVNHFIIVFKARNDNATTDDSLFSWPDKTGLSKINYLGICTLPRSVHLVESGAAIDFSEDFSQNLSSGDQAYSTQEPETTTTEKKAETTTTTKRAETATTKTRVTFAPKETTGGPKRRYSYKDFKSRTKPTTSEASPVGSLKEESTIPSKTTKEKWSTQRRHLKKTSTERNTYEKVGSSMEDSSSESGQEKPSTTTTMVTKEASTFSKIKAKKSNLYRGPPNDSKNSEEESESDEEESESDEEPDPIYLGKKK